MPSKADNQLWSGLCPIERDEVLADLLGQAAARKSGTPAQLLQQLTRSVPAPLPAVAPGTMIPPGSSTQAAAHLTPALLTQLAQLHHKVATAVTACQNQTKQQARARRRHAIRRILAPIIKTAAVTSAVLLFSLGLSAHRDGSRAAADAASARAELAAAEQELEDAKTSRGALATEITQLEARILETLPNRIESVRQALATTSRTWQELETEAKALAQPPSRPSNTTNLVQSTLQTIASWRNRLAQHDRLLVQLNVTPATLTEADRLIQTGEGLLAEARAEDGKVRASLAFVPLLSAMQTAFAIPSGASDAFDNPVVTRQGGRTDPASNLPLEIVHRASGLVLVLVPAGQFQMGSPGNEPGRDADEGPVHDVRFDQPFYLGKYEVTQDQWQKEMGDNPSNFKGDGRRPVENVSWEDAQRLVGKLNESLAGMAGLRFGLPREAEWEYACRAGSTGRFGYGDEESQLGEYAWFDGNSGSSSHPVGRKKANGWGLYDLHGNVWEWCSDWYGAYSGNAVVDPVGPALGSYRVLRGGCWYLEAGICRSAFRNGNWPVFRNNFLGFRLALWPVQAK